MGQTILSSQPEQILALSTLPGLAAPDALKAAAYLVERHLIESNQLL